MKIALAALVLALAPAQETREAQELLRKARAMRYDPQLLPQARAAFESFLRTYPQSQAVPEVMIELAHCHGPTVQERRAALDLLRKVVEKYPGTHHEHRAMELVQKIGEWGFTQFPREAPIGPAVGVRASRKGKGKSRYVLSHRPNADLLRVLETYSLDKEPPEVPAERWVRIAEETVEYQHPAGEAQERELIFDLSKPGLYRVEETIDGFRQVAHVWAASFGILARSLGGRLVAFAYDPWTGRPVEGVDLRLRRAAGTASARSGRDGLAWFDLAAGETGLVTATRGDELRFCVFHGEAQAKEALVYITTDRPIYRPGQTVFWKAVLRDRQGDQLLVRAGGRTRAEIRDPEGRVLDVREHAWNDAGTISGSFRLGDEPPLGRYRVVVREKKSGGWFNFGDDGEENPWTKPFRVAAYRKPDARVTVEFADARPVAGAKQRAKIRAEYFFGGPVANAEVSWTVSAPWESDENPWPRPPFEDPHAWFYERVRDEEYDPEEYDGDEVAAGRGTTGADGTLEIEFPTADSPRARPYTVRAAVTEEARTRSEGVARVVVAASSLRISVGAARLFYASGDVVQVRTRVTTLDGKPSADRAVDVMAFGEEKGPGEQAEFESFFTGKSVTDAHGYAGFAVPLERTGRIRLKARVRDEAGRAVEDRADFWSAGEGMPPLQEGNDLQVLPDRVVYEEGETIRLLVRSTVKPLQALLTIEGGSIQEARVVELRRLNEVIEIPARASFAPNVFIKLSAWKDGKPWGGGYEVLVLPKHRFLDVAVKTDRATYGPRAKARVSVAVTGQGKPATAEVELAIVDESILQVQADRTPDIRLFFNRRREDDTAVDGSGPYVDAYDAFDGRGRRRNTAPLTGASFGLEESKDASPGEVFAHAETRRFFPDTLHWTAHLKTGADGRAEVEVETPDSLTSWRVLARAVSGADRSGWGVSSVVTRKDVIVRLSAPRFYTERDSGTVSTIVHNDLDRETEFTVRLAAEGGEGGGERKVKVPSKGVRREDWTVQAPRAGTLKLRAEALSRAESDAMELEIPVRPHGLEVWTSRSGGVKGSWTGELVLPQDAPPANASLEVTVTAGTMPAVLEALPFLAGYPYGCVEQTMSRFLPSVTAAASLRRLGMRNEALEKSLPDMVSKGLQRIYGFQHEDGGWGWWKHDATHPFMTAYALFGLVSARRAGFEVDAATIERGLDELMTMDLTPFSLYVMSLAGRNVKAEAVAFPAPPDAEGRAYLVLAGRADLLATLAAEGAEGPTSVRTWGLLLRTIVSADPQDARVGPLVEKLLSARRGAAWYSTLDSAWAVFGLSEAAAAEKEPEEVRVQVNGVDVAARPGRVRLSGKDVRPGANTVVVTERGGTRVFASALLRHFSGREQLEAQAGAITVGRRFDREVRDEKGEVRWERLRSGDAVRSGERIRVQVTVSGDARSEYVMVESPIAAGTEAWEATAEEFDWSVSWYGRRELRDDRVAVAGASVWREWNTFDFFLAPTLPGDYHVLPAVAFAMYDPDRRGSSEEFRLRIVE